MGIMINEISSGRPRLWHGLQKQGILFVSIAEMSMIM